MIFSRLASSDFSYYLNFDSQRRIKLCDNWRFKDRIGYNDKRSIQTVLIVATSAESSQCENRIVVNWPLEPRSSSGKILSNVLQNQRHLFDVFVAKQFNELVADREGAITRKQHSEGSTKSSLHSTIWIGQHRMDIESCVKHLVAPTAPDSPWLTWFLANRWSKESDF
ncbi:hypothetical protein NE237_022653 [Protea cynaroides]|uniref:Uncharacterized protein n=1 Tax=Protea cynaroides TaxID=273540 RepID=A0A9Q0HBF3_9MAGN|nr:hypothetical protein NE237_022653 [Protea cynaroides]